MRRITKTSQVLNHLKQFGSITSIEAIEMYGATRLAAIIFELRKRGYHIETIRMNFIDRYGNACTYGKYVMVN